ncbi:MAG: hypothetical protein IE920_03115 [Thiotrichales bacterium]|nr:hypothetical protein [Thiotrichales bacterium]
MNVQALDEKTMVLKYPTQPEWIVILLVVPIILGLIIYASVDSELRTKVDWISLFIGLLTSLPIIMIWFNQLRSRWISRLDTYLNVTLKHKDRIVAKVEYVYVDNGIDIRQQAQTVLSGLTKDKRLGYLEQFIRPGKDSFAKEKIYKDLCGVLSDGNPFERVDVTLFLTKPPVEIEPDAYSLIKETDWSLKDEDGKPLYDKKQVYVEKGRYWRWCPLCENGLYSEKFTLTELNGSE